jgi:protein-S-isoprenylcysteine O-methyltransferase Ste14
MVFLFHGSLNLVNLGLGEIAGLGLNGFLSLAFFIQQSVMLRRSFRRWLAKFIREQYHGALFTIASGVVLLILVVFWQKSAYVLAAPQGIIRWLMRAVFILAILGFYWGFRALGSFDAFGLSPILNNLRGTVPPPMPFIVRGPYLWVRHPLYFFSLLLIWSCPDLSLDRLLYNILWSIWIIVGSVLEERDLVADFGGPYRDYQSKVPMLIP